MCSRRREPQGGKNFPQREQQAHPHHVGQVPQLYANDSTAPSQQPWGSGWAAAPERCEVKSPRPEGACWDQSALREQRWVRAWRKKSLEAWLGLALRSCNMARNAPSVP